MKTIRDPSYHRYSFQQIWVACAFVLLKGN